MTTLRAWDLIGFPDYCDPETGEVVASSGFVRVKGGRTLYEAVSYNDETARSNNVKLARLIAGPDGIRQVNRYVDPDTELEIVE